MDVNIIREALLVVAFAVFCAIVWWAYGAGRRQRFERAANSVFDDDGEDRSDLHGASRREGK